MPGFVTQTPDDRLRDAKATLDALVETVEVPTDRAGGDVPFRRVRAVHSAIEKVQAAVDALIDDDRAAAA